jgi:hypothetical protein
MEKGEGPVYFGLKTNGVLFKKDQACDLVAVWVPPSSAHGIWIEFVDSRGNKQAGK